VLKVVVVLLLLLLLLLGEAAARPAGPCLLVLLLLLITRGASRPACGSCGWMWEHSGRRWTRGQVRQPAAFCV
jgi:hypothetical protein